MKAVVFFGEGFEEVEALAVVDILRRGEVEVIMAGISGREVTSSRKVIIKMDATVEEIAYDTVDMLIVPGGVPGVHNIYNSEVVKEKLKHFKVSGKWLAAICAGPGVLGKCELLHGHQAVCYPGFEHELKGAEVVTDRVVVSGKMITSIGAGASFEFALKLLEVLKGKEMSKKIKDAMHII